MKKGFTLIELLVVVLIIGILAAVALPQYQKSVLKSRYSSLMPLGKALSDANEVYFLNNGEYTDDIEELDVVTEDTEADVILGVEVQRSYVELTRDDINNNLVFYQKHSPNFPGEIHCEALTGNELANWLCKDGLKGTLVGAAEGYQVYSLDENFSGTLARTYYSLPDGSSMKNGDICIADQKNTCQRITVDHAKCIAGKNTGYACGGNPSGGYKNYSECEGNAVNSCGGAITFTNHSICYGNASYGCYWNTFKNYSTCESNAAGSCNARTFDNYSVCEANVSGGCNADKYVTPTFKNNSSCVGNYNNTCKNVVFDTNSVCYAKALGACAGSTYKGGAYCAGGEGGSFCPNGAASNTAGYVWYREEDWGADKESILKPQSES